MVEKAHEIHKYKGLKLSLNKFNTTEQKNATSTTAYINCKTIRETETNG